MHTHTHTYTHREREREKKKRERERRTRAQVHAHPDSRPPLPSLLIHSQDAMALLAGASPAVLSGIGRATVDKLASIGANTCADVLAVPAAVLRERFGATQGAHLQAMARGDDPSTADFDVWADVDEIPATLQSVVSYGVRPQTQDELDSLVASIVDRLVERLADEDLKAGFVRFQHLYSCPHARIASEHTSTPSSIFTCAVVSVAFTQPPMHALLAHILEHKQSRKASLR